ncbi:MAG: hypothetical protein QG656_267, partial [Candidatus Hydrogenedentes bacterium]|nr:hypothetical protein [Candidatus Hydrogenedentota bacterium]
MLFPVLVGFALVLCVCRIATASELLIEQVVASETGFDGAVTVVETSEQNSVEMVTVDIPYRDVNGDTKMGQARLFVRREDLATGKPIPPFCHVHYERDPATAAGTCERGWAVSTAHYQEAGGKYPIDVAVGNGYNLARAIVQWVRRLPFIDRTHLHIDGGSQGGYMALAMTAEFFPVAATTADCPVVNWAYNFNYFEANKKAAEWPRLGMDDSPLPIVNAVELITNWAYGVFGNDLTSDTWYRLSPIACLDCITNPVLAVCATGDMLVPMEQM